jgi:hypothetical protein
MGLEFLLKPVMADDLRQHIGAVLNQPHHDLAR